MKCPNCNGSGKIFWIDDHTFVNEGEDCPACHGKGFIEQTNEEWLHSMTTEEKAKWLSEHLHCGDCDIENRVCAGTYSGCKETLVGWLKAVHKE